MSESIRNLVINKQWDLLIPLIESKYGVTLPRSEFIAEIHKALAGVDTTLDHFCLGREGQNSTWDLWIKNRLDALHISLAKRCGDSPDYEHFTSAVLHIFFIWLEETQEMLDRLKGESTQKSSVARSKITNTEVKIKPIDVTAAKVGPQQ